MCFTSKNPRSTAGAAETPDWTSVLCLGCGDPLGRHLCVHVLSDLFGVSERDVRLMHTHGALHSSPSASGLTCPKSLGSYMARVIDGAVTDRWTTRIRGRLINDLNAALNAQGDGPLGPSR